MTIQDLGSIGELVAAVATIITLGYLAVQIRQNSRLQGETAKRATQAVVHQQNLLTVQDPETLDLLTRGMADWSSLAGGERVRAHNYFMSMFINYQEAFYQVKQLGVDDEWWNILEKHMFLYLGSPGLTGWWKKNRTTFGTDFVEFVEQNRDSVGIADQQGGETDTE